jgi:hypothetical protein
MSRARFLREGDRTAGSRRRRRLASHGRSAGATFVCRRRASSRRAFGGDHNADASQVRAQHAPPQKARRPLAGGAGCRLRTAPNGDQPAGASSAIAATRDDRDRGAGSRTRLASRTARRNRLTLSCGIKRWHLSQPPTRAAARTPRTSCRDGRCLAMPTASRDGHDAIKSEPCSRRTYACPPHSMATASRARR